MTAFTAMISDAISTTFEIVGISTSDKATVIAVGFGSQDEAAQYAMDYDTTAGMKEVWIERVRFKLNRTYVQNIYPAN